MCFDWLVEVHFKNLYKYYGFYTEAAVVAIHYN